MTGFIPEFEQRDFKPRADELRLEGAPGGEDFVIVSAGPRAARSHMLAILWIGMAPVRHRDAQATAGPEKLEAMRRRALRLLESKMREDVLGEKSLTRPR